jgi:hypothetical protein
MQAHIPIFDREKGSFVSCKLHAAAVVVESAATISVASVLITLRNIYARHVALNPPVNSRTRPRSQVSKDTVGTRRFSVSCEFNQGYLKPTHSGCENQCGGHYYVSPLVKRLVLIK